MSNERHIWIGLRKIAGPPKHKQAAGTSRQPAPVGTRGWL